MTIDNYMTVNEASERYQINVETIKNKLKPSIPTQWKQTELMIEKGMLKFFKKGERREWILSANAMETWFENKKREFLK